MKIDVRFTPAMVDSPAALDGCAAVVVDTLRATTSIVAALMAGAREIVPVATPADAVAIAQRLGSDRTLLCGERHARPIEGFNLGNSPAEYTPEVVRGKTLVMTTTNGTAAVLAASRASLLLCACLNNAGVAAERVERSGFEQLVVVCAGTEGRFAIEDAIAAGAVIRRLMERREDVLLNDASRVSVALFEQFEHDLVRALTQSDHGSFLVAAGMHDDIERCARCDIPGAVVPTLIASMLRLDEVPEPLSSIR